MAGGLRRKIEAVSEGNSLFRLPCRALLCLQEEGLSEFLYRTESRISGRNAARKFWKSLQLTEKEKQRQRETVFPEEHRISILVPLYNTPESFLAEMIQSVLGQTFEGWELCLADGSDEGHPEVGEYCRKRAEEDSRIRYRKLEKNGGISENTNACLEMATGDYIALFDHDDVLRENALFEVMQAICCRGADFVYTDELVFASPDRRRVIGYHCKPDFAPDNLLANNYICHLTVFRTILLKKAGFFRKAYDGSQDHDLMLRLTDQAEKIVHIPKVLYDWRSHPASVASDIGSKSYAVDAGLRAVRDFLEGKGYAAEVTSSPVYPTMYKVSWPLQGTPRIVLAAEDGGNWEETVRWLREVQKRTAWPEMEIRVATRRTDVKPEGGILPVPTGPEGKSGKLNAAAGQTGEAAEPEMLLFLERGLLPERPDWVEELLRQAVRPELGAVGGRSLFENGTVRQAGIILGLGRHGAAGRSHYRARGDSAGYFGQLAMAENRSAVSAECLMIRTALFRRMNGFDPAFGNALYDTDLCLRLVQEGYRNLYTPYAEVRGGSKNHVPLEPGRKEKGYEASVRLFRRKWKELLAAGDPLYNPNLSLRMGDYRISGRKTSTEQQQERRCSTETKSGIQ